MDQNDSFYIPLVTSAQCIFRAEKRPDDKVSINYNDDYSEGYGRSKEDFKAPRKNNILQP